MEIAKVKMSLGEFREWSEKLRTTVALELEELAKRNTELQVTVEVQKLRLQPLQIMEQQMLAQEELSLSAVLMNEGEVAILKQQLALAAQELWQKTKERLSFVIKYPYEVLKAGMVSEAEAQLLKDVEELQKERDFWKQQVQEMKANLTQQIPMEEKEDDFLTNTVLLQEEDTVRNADFQIAEVVADIAQDAEMDKVKEDAGILMDAEKEKVKEGDVLAAEIVLENMDAEQHIPGNAVEQQKAV